MIINALLLMHNINYKFIYFNILNGFLTVIQLLPVAATPNIRLSPADFTNDPVRKKEIKAELIEINKRRGLESC